MKYLKKIPAGVKKAFAFALVLFFSIFLWGNHYSLKPHEFIQTGLKIIATPLFSYVYEDDAKKVENIYRSYYINSGASYSINNTYADNKKHLINKIRILERSNNEFPIENIPFVFENVDADYLVNMRQRFKLEEIAGEAKSEYEAMLKIGAWIGSQWDHGFDIDRVPGSRESFCATDVIDAGVDGARFWCEIASKSTAQVASSMGWPARVISAFKTGYDFKIGRHAVAELWSNQFNKWFVMDTDFNVVFEYDGIPLSAYELCHYPELKKTESFYVRHFVTPKPSLPYNDIIAFLNYIHVDLRNDWASRILPRGSPARGDLATWWTARSDMTPVLTAKIRVDDESRFNWKVNNIYIEILDLQKSSNIYEITIGLSSYSPYFKKLLISIDGSKFEEIEIYKPYSFKVKEGTHTLKAQIIGKRETEGPISSLTFQLQ